MADVRSNPGIGRVRLSAWIGGMILGAWLIAIALPYPAVSETERFVDGLAAFDAGDLAETIRIWSALADGGEAAAQVGLAGLYLAGNGVARDPVEAARLYRLAAEQGDMNGQLNLGRLYWQGLGVERNPARAYSWLSLAAGQGRRWAKEKSLEIEATMSPTERAEAAAMIEAFEAR